MTSNDIVASARRMLEDSVSPYRWSDAELIEYIQYGIDELNRIRPDTKYVSGVYNSRIELPESASSDIDIGEEFMEALAHYVAYMAYLNDSSDTVNYKMSESQYNLFMVHAKS